MSTETRVARPLWRGRAGGRSLLFFGVLLSMAALPLPRAACGYSPSSPEVRQLVGAGLRYLETRGPNDSRIGAQALVGMAFFKAGAPADHPAIVHAIDAIRKAVEALKVDGNQSLDIYSAGLATIFLVEYDSAEFAAEIDKLIAYLEAVQKPCGGWGYSGRDTGDTSMTQYAVLAMWEALRAGHRVPNHMLTGVATWLVRTQDPSGGFGYQGTVSPNFTPVPQSEVRISMTTAGLASVYVISDLMGIVGRAERDDDLPPALQEVQRAQPAGAGRGLVQVDPRLLLEVQKRGNAWMQAHYSIDSGRWNYYYLYALERYWSFRCAVERRSDRGGFWYDDGVRFLMERQNQNGGWQGDSGDVPSTAFAVLFLVRSTQRTIQRVQSFGDGTLVGGRGLPKNTAAVTLVQGQVVAKPELGALDKMLAAIGDPNNPDKQAVAQTLAELPVEEAQVLASKYGKKLQELVGASSPEARLAAVRALARSGSLDSVPVLIYALTDPDPVIMREARDGLRRISRKFTGFGLGDEPTQAEIQRAVQAWRQWYISVRPDAEFED